MHDVVFHQESTSQSDPGSTRSDQSQVFNPIITNYNSHTWLVLLAVFRLRDIPVTRLRLFRFD